MKWLYYFVDINCLIRWWRKIFEVVLFIKFLNIISYDKENDLGNVLLIKDK